MKSGKSQSILTISAVAFVAAFLVDMYLIFAAASNIELIIAVSLIVIVDTYFLVDGILAKVDEVVSINIDKQNELTKVEKGIYSVAKREEISRGQSMSAIIDVVLDMKEENERMTEQLMEQDKLLAKLFIKKDMDNTTKMVNSNERIAVLLAQMAAANAKSQDESIEILNEMQKRLEENKADVDAEYAEFRNEYQKLEDAIKSHRKLEGGYSTPKSDDEMGFGETDKTSTDEMGFENNASSTDDNMGFGEVTQEPSDGMNFEDTVQNTGNGMGFEENNRKANDKMAFSEADKKSDGGMNVKENNQTSDEDVDFEVDTWEDDNTNFEERYQAPEEVVSDGNYREINDDDIRFDSYRGAEESYRELDDDDIWFEDEYPKYDEAELGKKYRQSDNLDNDYGRSEEAATEDIKADKEYRRFDDTMFEKVYPNPNGIRPERAYRDDNIENERRYFKADYNDSEFDGIYQRLDDDMEFDGIYRRLDDDTAFDGIYQRLGDEDTELDDIYRKLNEGHTELNDIYQKSKEDNKEQGVAQYPHLRMMEL